MTQINLSNDQDVPRLAIQALKQAQIRAMNSQAPLVYAANGQLIRRLPNGKVVAIKKLPNRINVKRLSKRSEP